MAGMRLVFCLWVGCLLSAFAETPSYITFPSDIDWVTRDTEHFTVLYRRGENRLAERTLLAAERAYRLLQPIFQETPPKTWIVLADFHDSLNGYAIDYPFPHFVIFASPPEPSGQLAALDGWLDSVVLHEYVHVLHLYPAHGAWSILESVFGSWVLPNGLMPSHLHEGLATFLETELSRGGRGKGASFSMLRRMAVHKGVWGKEFVPLDLLEGSVRWPQGQSPYFFGHLVFQELWNRKKAAGIHAFVQQTSRSFPYFFSGTVEEIYGEDYPTLWKTIFEKTQKTAQKEITDIENRPLSKLTYLTDSRYMKWDVQVSPDGEKLAYRRGHPDTGSTLEIRHISSGETVDTLRLEAGHQEGMCWIAQGDKNYLVFAETDNRFGYSLNQLRVYDTVEKNKFTPQFKSEPVARVQSIACGSKSLLTYQEQSGRGHVREWKPSSDWKTLDLLREWKIPEGDWATSLVATEPPLIALRKPISTVFYRWDEGEPQKAWELSGHFYHFGSPLPSGEWPVVSDVSGREEVWALDFEKKWARKIVSVLGGVNSFAHYRNRWWVSSYEHGGYDIAEAVPLPGQPEKLSQAPQTLRDIANTPSISDEKEYSAWSSLRPRAWIPSILIVPNGAQISAWIPGFDISQKHLYNLFGGYDTRGSPYIYADYSYRFHLGSQLNVQANYSPSYLISSKAFLHQWGTSIGLSTYFGPDLPRVSVNALFRRVESSAYGPANQSVGAGVSVSQTFLARTAPRAIAPRFATVVSINHSQYFRALGSTDNYFATMASLDQYLPNPLLDRHVLKIGAKFGITQGTALYNSFFQGGGELMFSPGRGFFLNRGFLPGLFSSQKMFCLNLDYLFPIVEVERGWNHWPFFLKRLDGALVLDATTLGTFRNFYYSTGIELKSYWKTFFYFPTVIRVGGYHGFGPFGEAVYTTMAIEASI